MRTGIIVSCSFIVAGLWTASPGAFADDVPVPEPTRQQLLDPVWIEETLGDIGVDRLIKLYDAENDAVLSQIQEALALSRSFLNEHPEELRSQLQARLLTATEPELATFQDLPADRVRARLTRPSLIQSGDALLGRFPRENEASQVVSSPDGALFAAHSLRIKVSGQIENLYGLEVRSGETGELVRLITHADNASIVPTGISPDCERVFGITLDGKIHAWDLDTGEEVWNAFCGVSEHLYRAVCAFSPDGSLMASHTYVEFVSILNVETGEVVATMRAEGVERIRDMAFLDNDTLVGWSFDNYLRHWSIADDEVIASFEVPEGYLSRDGTKAIGLVKQMVDEDRRFSGFDIFDALTGEAIDHVEFDAPIELPRATFDLTGEQILIWMNRPRRQLLGYSISTGEPTVDLDLRGLWFQDLAPLAGNRIVNSGQNELNLWDLNRPRVPASGIDPTFPPSEIAISADGSTVMTAYRDIIYLQDTSTWRETARFTLPDRPRYLDMSDDARIIVFSLKNEVHSLNVATGEMKQLHNTGVADDEIHDLQMSGDGQVAVFKVNSDKAYVIDTDDGTLLSSTDASPDLSISYDGSRVLLNQRLLDRDAGVEQELENIYGFPFAISADGQMGIFYNPFTFNSVWDLDKEELLKDAAHSAEVEWFSNLSKPVAISGNGRFSVSCGADLEVYLYDIRDRRQLAVVPSDASRIAALEISENGEHLVIAGDDGVWHHFRFENLPP